MKHYRVSPDARADLDNIYDYVARENLTAADGLVDKFKAKFILLARHPLMGQSRPELAPNLRSTPVGNYVILYRPSNDGIEIARIIHSARDMDAQF